MDNQLQIETNGTKYLSTKDDPLTVPIYGTRKSSRRLNQINLNNSDHNFNNLEHSTQPSAAKETNVKEHPTQTESSKINHSTVNNQTATNQTNQPTSTNNPATKQQRKWEQWQQDDTRWFFEALNENGKDFNAIHSYMTNRLKKKG